jgi:F-type H+-transporting ATPase subunit b
MIRGWLTGLLALGLLAALAPGRAGADGGHSGGANKSLAELQKEFKELVEKGDYEEADKVLGEMVHHDLIGHHPDAASTTDPARLKELAVEAASKERYADADYYIVKLQKSKPPDVFGKALDLGIWTLVVFLVLLWVLARFAWKPLLQGLEHRESTIRSELEQAQHERQEAQALNERWKDEMAKAQDQVRGLLDEARRNGQHAAEELLNKAKADAQAERERGRREISLATDQALQQIAAQTANLAALVSSKALRREMTPDDHRRLVDEALAELNQARRKNGQG